MDLSALVYELTRLFPTDEKFGLSSQLRRAATSIPLNLAEGSGRETTPEFRRALYIARGSALEVDSAILLAERLGYLTEPQATEVIRLNDRVLALLNGLLNKSD